MKKKFSTPEYKKRNKQKSEKDLRNKVKRKGKVRVVKIKTPEPEEETEGYYNRRPKMPPPIIPMVAPSNFSLINNTEAVIEYFNAAHTELLNKNPILFDISNVSTLTTDAIAVQIAKIKDDKFHRKTGIIGNAPNDSSLQNLFFQSGFYEYVNTRGPKSKNDKKLLIHEITNNSVEPDIAKKACLLGLRHTFKNDEIFEPLYDILIEVMQNTNNHAGDERGNYDWWLHVYNHPDSSRTSYTFLDLGVGIFESLPVRSFKRDVLEFLNIKSNLDLVPKLFAGEIKSRTARPERGKGIPQVFECSQDKVFDKFILISNDIYADLKTKEYKKIGTEFEGTLFYWEIINENEHGS